MVAVSTWRQLSDIPVLREGEIHLYRLHLDEAIDQYQNLLSDDEIIRAERLLDPQKQQFFITGRGQLRQILSRYLHTSPEKIIFQYNDSGKPSLSPVYGSDITFNLSHSAHLAVVAVTCHSDVGIDIEKIDPDLEFLQLASNFFSQKEQQRLQGVSFHKQRRTFYRLWTIKEALLKMTGTVFFYSEADGFSAARSYHFFLSSEFVATVAVVGEIQIFSRFDVSA